MFAGSAVRAAARSACVALGLLVVAACGVDAPEQAVGRVVSPTSTSSTSPSATVAATTTPSTGKPAPDAASHGAPEVVDDDDVVDAVVPSPGCEARTSLEAGVHLRPWLDVDRQVIVRLPVEPPAQPVPVVFNLHGSASNAARHETYVHFSVPAAERGFLVLTPEGMPPAEGEHQVWEYLPGIPPDDPGYLASLVDWVGDAHCVDLNRVFAAGYSNGSAMANVIACHTGGRFRAVAGVGAHRFPLRCPSGPVSVLGIHGTADPIVPYQGGPLLRRPEIWMPPVEETFATWASAAACDPAPRYEILDDDVTRRRWQKCHDGVQVVLYAVESAGHEWPWPDDPFTPGKLDATATILDFFESH